MRKLSSIRGMSCKSAKAITFHKVLSLVEIIEPSLSLVELLNLFSHWLMESNNFGTLARHCSKRRHLTYATVFGSNEYSNQFWLFLSRMLFFPRTPFNPVDTKYIMYIIFASLTVNIIILYIKAKYYRLHNRFIIYI